MVSRLALALGGLLGLGCNGFAPASGACDSDADCEPPAVCSVRAGVCHIPDTETSCLANEDCDALSTCVGGTCARRPPVIALVNNPVGGALELPARVQHAAVRYALEEVQESTGEFGVEFELFYRFAGFEEGQILQTFAAVEAAGASVVLTLGEDVTRQAQRYFAGRRTLVIGVFANYASFETAEPSGIRTTYALAPAPRADFAMWGKYLVERQLCTRATTVYVRSPADQFVVEILEEEVPRQGLPVTAAIGLIPGANPADAVRQVVQSGADCVFALPVAAETPVDTFAAFYEAFLLDDESRAAAPRWLFPSLQRWTATVRSLSPTARSALEGGIVVSYEIGGNRADSVREAFYDFYTERYATPCPGEQCFDPLLPERLPDHAVYFDFGYDQAVLAALTLSRAHGESAPSRTSIRRNFQAINSGGPDAAVCRAGDVRPCVEGALVGAVPSYTGASGPLSFGEDGRVRTVDESMVFNRVGAAGTLVEGERFSGEDMAAALAEADAR